MNKISIITGGGTGIGKALAIYLAREKNLKVMVVGRRLEKLNETKAACPKNIEMVNADVSNDSGRQKIYNTVPADHAVQFLVHNAAALGPVKPLMEFSVEEWREHLAINVEGPLFLTQKLLSKLSGGRVLHISSGAAHHGYAGWGAYCTSKAALHSIYEVLREEVKKNDVLVGSVRPGVVDTPMQDQVRSASEADFPMLQKFVKLKNKGQLIDSEQIARFLAYILSNTSDEQFIAQEWDFRDHSDLQNQT